MFNNDFFKLNIRKFYVSRQCKKDRATLKVDIKT